METDICDFDLESRIRNYSGNKDYALMDMEQDAAVNSQISQNCPNQ
jgi:hypothetical protein